MVLDTIDKYHIGTNDIPAEVEECVHVLIQEQCEAQPDATAVHAWDGDFTYAELDRLSSQLAEHLAAMGVGPEVFVPLCFEKSRWTPVAMLAVMKAGGAFVLLEPSHPLQRLQTICEAVQATLVVSSSGQTAVAKALADTVVTVDDTDRGTCWRTGHRSDITQVDPNNAAYAVFTSGTTGQPKGVVIHHSAFATSTTYFGRQIMLSPTSRTLQFSSYAFDATLLESMATLIHGGCVCIPTDTDLRADLARTIRAIGANTLMLTPSVTRILAPEGIPDVQTLVFVGEAMVKEDIIRWSSHVHVMNAYGPAECAIVMSVKTSIGNDTDPQIIGQGTGAVGWIVHPDDHEQLLPIGAVGELVIEGPTVGRGYLNDPEQTAAVFIEPPRWLSRFRERLDTDTRLYKTGDLAQYVADGSLRYVGRKDTQVKLRGQRLELSEVEHHVRKSFDGERAVVAEVVVPADDGARPVLACFIWTGSGQSVDDGTPLAEPTEAFRAAAQAADVILRDRLPDFMVPSLYLPLRFIPLATTGKTDRRRLRSLVAALARSDLEQYMAQPAVAKRIPSSPMERTLQQLWADVLCVPSDSIGVDDSFFRLGGDSITAMQLVAAARSASVAITVADLFAHPRIADLASVVVTAPSLQYEEQVAPFCLLGDSLTQDRVRTLVQLQLNCDQDQIEDIYPCTPMQQGLIALTSKDRSAYVVRWVYNLSQNTDPDRFRAAWDTVAEMNPILRTRILNTGSEGTFQVVLRHPLTWHNGNDLDTYLHWDMDAPIELNSPLLRLAIITPPTDQDTSQFVLTIHHALCDGWSLPIIFRQLEVAYRRDRLSKRQFTSFLRYLSGLNIPALEHFWRSQFTGYTGASFLTALAAGHMASPSSTLSHSVELGARRSSVATRSIAIRLAWAVVLSEFLSSDDIVFGATVNGRNADMADIDLVTGPTIATVPVRVQLKRNQPIKEILQNMQKQAIDMIPFEQAGLHRISQLGDEARLACQFQSLLVVQPPSEADAIETFGQRQDEGGIAMGAGIFQGYALTVMCELGGDQVGINIEFDGRVVSEVTVQQMIWQFGHILHEIVWSPESTLGELNLISSEDAAKLTEWNGVVPAKVERCVHELIQEQCEAQPDTTAVHAWDGDFTYAELDRLSSQLAEHLAAVGVGPEVFVPLCFEKSRWTPVAMLAVLKAGGAFVLLDPSHPLQRLQTICEAVQATLVVSSSGQTAVAKALADTVVTVDDTDLGMIWRTGERGRITTATPDNAAYTVFTSGTTGQPKGVVIHHSAFATSASYFGRYIMLSPTSRTLQFSSYAFDAAVVEIIATLVHGGSVCVPADANAKSNLANSIQAIGSNILILTPSLTRILQPDSLMTVQTVVFIGEAMTEEDFVRWSLHVQVINGYGPAECAAASSAQIMTDTLDTKIIGRGTGAVGWIVHPDDHEQLLPIGAVGELVIEGPTVGRGYLNDPEQTTAVFIEPPRWLSQFRETLGTETRLYKTGDLAQYVADGSLRYVGRKDTQVKLRGQRLELSEVEHHVRQCFDGGRTVVAEVVVPADDGARPVLACFIWTGSGQSVDDGTPLAEPTDSFQAAAQAVDVVLRDRLPDFMVPSLYLPLRFVPLATTGKTDRRRLRSLVAALARSDLEQYMAQPAVAKRIPSSPMERTLQQLWADVLCVPSDSIGVDDSFFRLGGDSITAMQVSALARENGLVLPVADIFRFPSLAYMALHISDTPSSHIPHLSPSQHCIDTFKSTKVLQILGLSPDHVLEVLPATSFQGSTLSAEPSRYFLIPVNHHVNIAALREAALTVLKHHDILRTVFATLDGQTFQVILRDNLSLFSVITTCEELVHFCQKLCAEDSYSISPFGTPLFRITLVSRDISTHMLILRISHAQYDGISFSQLLKNLSLAYAGSPLSPTLSFSKYMQYRQSLKTEEIFQFWRSYLRGSSLQSLSTLSLGERNTVPAENIHLVQKIRIPEFPANLTLATVTKAAWSLVFAKLMGVNDLILGQLVSGRNIPMMGIQNVIGPTINIVPARFSLQKSWVIMDLLQHVQDRHVETVDFESLDFGDIVKNCTQWPESSRLDCIVQHQLADEKIPFSLNGSVSHVRPMLLPPRSIPMDFHGLTLSSHTTLEVHVTASSMLITKSLAEFILKDFCQTIPFLLRNTTLPLETVIPFGCD